MRVFDRFPPRYLVPNAVTCTSIVLGLASLRTSLTATSHDDFVAAAWLIMWTVLLDKLDGTLARRLGATSELGVQLDSFSDFVTFGIAPAALLTRAVPWSLPARFGAGPAHGALLVVGALYVVATALRLAKFNVATAGPSTGYFSGLPSTSSGGLLAVAFLAHGQLGLPRAWLGGFVAFMALNAALMVSNLPMPKVRLSDNRLRRSLQVLVIVSVYVFIPLHFMPAYLLAVAATYTVGGFVYGIVNARS